MDTKPHCDSLQLPDTDFPLTSKGIEEEESTMPWGCTPGSCYLVRSRLKCLCGLFLLKDLMKSSSAFVGSPQSPFCQYRRSMAITTDHF